MPAPAFDPLNRRSAWQPIEGPFGRMASEQAALDNPALRGGLIERVRPETEALAEHLDRVLSHWLHPSPNSTAGQR